MKKGHHLLILESKETCCKTAVDKFKNNTNNISYLIGNDPMIAYEIDGLKLLSIIKENKLYPKFLILSILGLLIGIPDIWIVKFLRSNSERQKWAFFLSIIQVHFNVGCCCFCQVLFITFLLLN